MPAGSNVTRLQSTFYELLGDAICQADSPRLQELRSDVPRWLDELVAGALSKQCAQRPNAAELAFRLRSEVGEAIVSARPETHAWHTDAPPAAMIGSLPEDRFARGTAYAMQDRPKEAARAFQAVLRDNPDNLAARYNLGLVLIQQGRLEDAIQEFSTALHLSPDFGEAHCGLGMAYEGARPPG